MDDFSDIIRKVGDERYGSSGDIVNVVEFIEDRIFGIGLKLFPIQRIIIKAHYGILLDDDEDCPTVKLRNWRGEHLETITEAEYLRRAYDEGRCNIREVIEGVELPDMVLSIGRRSGKTLIASCITAYETYKLIKKGNPHKYYGLPESNPIQLISVATDKEQAGILFNEVSSHYRNCEFFRKYLSNSTGTYAKFQTPLDLEKFGSYEDDKYARRSINVTFKSCVAKSLRGPGNIMIILDEVAHFVDSSNQASAKAIYEAVNPSRAAFSPKSPHDKTEYIGPCEARMVMISTPLGKSGFFYDKFQQGMRGAPKHFCLQAPTWEVNPSIDADFFINSYTEDARSFFQEFGAEFSDGTKGWIEDTQDLYDCINPNLKPMTQGIPKQPYFMGLDVGIIKDATAIALGHIDYKRRKIVLDFIAQIQVGHGAHEFETEGPNKGQKKKKLDFEKDIAVWVIELCKKFNIIDGAYDQEQGLALESHLKHRGITKIRMEHMSNRLNHEIYSTFKNYMFDQRFELFNTSEGEGKYDDYIKQICDLQCEKMGNNMVKVFAPKRKDCFDDYADAIARMVWVASGRFAENHITTHVDSSYITRTGNVDGYISNARKRFQNYRSLGGTHQNRMRRQPPKGRGTARSARGRSRY